MQPVTHKPRHAPTRPSHHRRLLPATHSRSRVFQDAIRQNLQDLTLRPHIAGSINDLRTAEYVRDKVSCCRHSPCSKCGLLHDKMAVITSGCCCR